MVKITLHRALSELKLIDSKIEKQITTIEPVGIYQKDKKINNTTDKEEYERDAKSKYDSISSLIERKTEIKSKLVAKNSETYVEVGGVKMTIADAITKKSFIKFKKLLLSRLQARYKEATGLMNKNNEVVEGNVQRLLESAYGKDHVSVKKEDADNIRTPYTDANTWHLFDPIKIKEKIESLEKEISDFETQIDYVLSEVNSTTFIEVKE